jgi:hypothetical protein
MACAPLRDRGRICHGGKCGSTGLGARRGGEAHEDAGRQGGRQAAHRGSAAAPLTPETLAALVVDALGRVTAVITRVIEGAENHEQAFARLVEAEVGRQLHQCTAAFSSAQRAIDLVRATR